MVRGVFIIFLLVFSMLAVAETSLWKVTKNGKHLYLGGTIHVLAPSDYPLPKAFDVAYRDAALVVFETDISGLQSAEFQQSMITKMTYQDGRTLQTVLNAPTYSALQKYSASIGLPIETLDRFRPGMLSVMLTLMELQRLGMGEAGVDAFYTELATKDGKKLGELESIHEQLDYMMSLGKGHENELVMQSLEDLKRLPKLMNQMKSAWRHGKNDQLFDVTVKDIKLNFPSVYHSLLVSRNRKWLPKIETYLSTDEVELVLVGAAHLVGSESVLALLKAKGYSIQQL